MAAPTARSLSPWWALLLLPTGLAAGWAVGELPGPESSPASAPQAASAVAGRSGRSQWTSMDDAMDESRQSGKPILIDFNAEWCGPCRAMKREVFENGALASAVETAVIPVSIVDRRREDGHNSPQVEDLQSKYQVDAFPTLVVFSPRSGRAMRTKGFGDADQTVAWITQAARQVQ